MDSVVANWPTVLTCLSAAIALFLRVKSGAGYSLALFVIISCASVIAVDYAYFDNSSPVNWHTIALLKVGAMSFVAFNLCLGTKVPYWWGVIALSLALDFLGNLCSLLDWIYLGGYQFATIYSIIGIVTALLEGIAAHGDNKLANHRDLRSGQFDSADRVHSAHNYYDQV